MKNNGFYKFSKYCLLILTLLAFLTPLWVSKELLFPFITSKAFYLRFLVEMGLPFFVYILLFDPKSRPSYKNPLHISVLVFWLVNIISAFLGVDSQKAIWGNFERMGGVFYLTHLILLYFYIVVLAKVDFKFLKAILYANIAIATALSIYAIFVRLGMTPWVPDPSLPRVSATFGNPIFFPSYLIPIMFLSVFWALRKKGGVRWVLIASVFLQLIAVFLSGTRGAVVGLILGGFIASLAAIIFSPRGKIRNYGAAAIVLLVLAGGGLYLNSDKLPQGSMLARVFKLNDGNTQARLIQWRVALTGFKDYPVFGTGAENYYVTGNKYYNPEIYKYDPSWFDKPHNYWLEVLVTNGVVGLLSYLAIILSCVFAFYKTWKWGATSLFSSAALFCGLLVYQIQNLFVFDTISASMSFFIFSGFTAFLWEKIIEPDLVQKNSKVKVKAAWYLGHSASLASFFVVLAVSVYSLWGFNIMPIKASKNTNYGYAYQSADPQKAENYFQEAVNNPFNFDQSETASKYQEFAINLLRNPGKNSPELISKVVSNATLALENVVKQNPYNPIIWQKLGMLNLNYEYLKGQSVSQKTISSIEKAIELAPKRTEAMSVMVQLQLLLGNLKEALTIAQTMQEINPSNLDILWQISVIKKDLGDMKAAVEISESLLDKDYNFQSAQVLAWLLQYYAKENNWQRAVQVAEKQVEVESQNVDLYSQLAVVYFNAGDKAKALELANRILQMDPGQKPKLEIILGQ